MGKYQRPPNNGTFRKTGRQEDQKIVGEDRLSKSGKKLAADRSGKNL
jgi:hypothetical protein